MATLKTVLDNESIKIGTAEWNAKLPAVEQDTEGVKLSLHYMLPETL